MAKGSTISIDVQDQLLKERPRKRRPGTIPYPVQFSKEMLVYDNWNNLFLTNLLRSLTLNQFNSPPSMVLDLGCGDGMWVIEAAKTWPETQFVGFDILTNQPNLGRPELDMADLATRVSWVHGNLLEPLPFVANHFDYVRICCIGLGVPEDEWQYLLEEIARIIKPGGAIEVIEEDLIFPCGRYRKDETLVARPGYASSSMLSYSSTLSSPSDYRPKSDSVSQPMTHSMDSTYNHSLIPEIEQLLDPQDHSKLQMAWQEMLQNRFLTPRVLSVLPFYLSASFRDIRILPTLHIALPANSHLEDSGYTSSSDPHYDAESDLAELYLDLKTHGIRLSTELHSDTSSTRSRAPTSHTVSSWASIHLARSVQVIRGCKEAIWAEYKVLKSFDEGTPDKVSVMRREEFEAAWVNWENDMKDRIGMRGKLCAHLSRMEPRASERTDWRVWRERARDVDLSEEDSYTGTANICRSLRGFVGRKPDINE